MDYNMLSIIRINKKSILSLTSIYSFILVFPAFGPVINSILGIMNGTVVSTIFLFSLIIGFTIPPLKLEKRYNYLPLLIIICFAAAVIFPYMNSYLQVLSIFIFGITSGRYAISWCYYFYGQILRSNSNNKIKFSYSIVIGYVLAFSYLGLYISNIIVPFMSKQFSALWGGLFLLFSLIFCKEVSFNNKYEEYNEEYNKIIFTLPLKPIIIIFLIFITAGTTYAGIYPNLSIGYEQYYNVLPFLFAAFISGYIADNKGRRILIFFGVGFLGLSFVFSFISNNILSYFLMQTFLQMGWAFMDAYAWITGIDYSLKKNNPIIIGYFVAVFLLGTLLGSILNNLYREQIFTSSLLNSLLTYFPLFIAMFFVAFLPETLNINKNIKAERKLEQLFSPLTSRELEIAKYLISDMTNDEISRKLYISPNTLKTHARNIYKKLDVNNKRELRKLTKKL